jgi:hypothetical protein
MQVSEIFTSHPRLALAHARTIVEQKMSVDRATLLFHICHICSAIVRNWLKAEATPAHDGGRFPESTCRRAPPASPVTGAHEPWRPVLKVLRTQGETGCSAVDDPEQKPPVRRSI